MQSKNNGLPALKGPAFDHQNFFQFVVANVRHYAIFATDTAGRVVSWNPGVEELLGYAEEEFVGQHVSVIFTPEDVAAKAPLLEARSAEERGKGEDQRWHVRRDGSRFWGNGLLMPLEEAGEIVGFVKILRDDTPRKLMETTLRENEALYRSIIENYPNGAVYVFDRELRFILVDGRGLAAAGATAEMFVGKRLREALAPRIADEMEPFYHAALGGERGSVQLDDGERLYDVFYAPIRDRQDGPDGEPEILWGMLLTQDITERHRRELELEQSRAETRRILGSITDAFFSLDREWRFTYLNREAEKLLQRRAGELLGRSVWDEFPEAVGSTFYREYRRAAETGETASFVEYYPPLESWFEVRAYPSEAGISVYFHNVNERRRSEQALRESEENYRLLFNSIDEGFCVIEMIFDERGAARDWKYLQANPAFTKHTGLDDALGKTIRELVPDIEPRWFEIYGRVLATGEPTRFVEYSSAFDRWFDFYAFRLGPSEARKVAVLFNDVSEQKRSEQRLQESAEKLRLALEGGNMGWWTFDPLTNRSEPDEKCLALFGLAPESFDFDVEKIFAAIHPEDQARVRAAMATAIDGQQLYQAEFRVVHSSGETHWLAGVGRGRYDDGRLVQMYGVNFDITERKTGEEKLRASEERFRGLQQATPDGFMIFEAVRGAAGAIEDFRWLYVNPAAEQIVGRAEADLIGKRLLEEMPGNRADGLFDAYVKVVETGELWRNEFSYMHEGLNHFFLSTAVKTGDGFAVAFSDVTERKRHEIEREELLVKERAARAEAESATRAKDEFLAVVTHELRSPLNSILGWNTMLKNQPSPAMLARVTEIVERQGKQQLQLIEDLLDSARIVSGKMIIEHEPVDLAGVITAALDIVRPAAQSKGVSLTLLINSSKEIVTGDAERLQQVVWNLLSNAVKFTPEGGRVEIELRREASDAVVIVRDTGKGIAPEFLPFVFDRFSQADSSKSRRFGGLGLGLSLVKQLTELHGGAIEVDSEGEGLGATFSIRLPVRAVTTAPGETNELPADWASPPREGRPDERRLEGVRILVADDMADARELVRFTLEAQGAHVETFASGALALAALGDGEIDARFDLFVCDIGMPDEDGYTVIKKLRDLEEERGGNLPAIALTAFTSLQDRARALEAGFQMHVGKPVDPAELVLIVQSLLTVKKLK